MTYREEKAKALWQHRRVFEMLLNAFGEIKNNRAYKSGRMGSYDARNLDDRINNVLIAADKMGIKTEELLEMAANPRLPLPDLMIQKLTQYSVVSEFRYRMWHGPVSGIDPAYKYDIKHIVGTYRDARRLLRTRYHMIPDADVLKYMPDGFLLKD